MSFFRRGGTDSTSETDPAAAESEPVAADDRAADRNPQKKGRPTPSRREQERARGVRRGPVTAPVSRKEARERRKTERASMTKDERKAARAEERRVREERRELMMAGDDRYVLPRDRGDVRRYARNWVDVHRRPINTFMVFALVFVFITVMPNRQLQVFAQMAFYALLLVFLVDAVLLGIQLNRAVRAKFPDTDDHGLGLGFYGVMRASQPRRLRTPKPVVAPGDEL